MDDSPDEMWFKSHPLLLIDLIVVDYTTTNNKNNILRHQHFLASPTFFELTFISAISLLAIAR